MPTTAERKALLFFAGILAVGLGVRVVRSASHGSATSLADTRALSAQIDAVDSARTHSKRRTKGRSVNGSRAVRERRPRAPRTYSPPSAVPSLTPVPLTPGAEPILRGGRAVRGRAPEARDEQPSTRPIDLDTAPASELERLPRIGPALARRIVADRDSLGPFGSLESFQRVRGVGPAMAAAVSSRVTFSKQARPSNAVVVPRVTPSPSSSKPPRRGPRL